MTPLWSACYAAAWFHATSTTYGGHVTDDERAAIAATHADRMVAALKRVREEVGDAE